MFGAGEGTGSVRETHGGGEIRAFRESDGERRAERIACADGIDGVDIERWLVHRRIANADGAVARRA